MSSELILCICITIGAMLNFDSDFAVHANGEVACKQSMQVINP